MSSSPSSRLTVGRLLMLASNISYSLGAFIADFNETHVLNPRWPPHAKFHNGQTMSLGVLLAGCAAYYLFRRVPNHGGGGAITIREEQDSLRTAAIVGSFYFAAGLSAIWYPETKWVDPEFGEGSPQLYIFGVPLVINWIGYAMESYRLGKVKGA